MENEQIPPEQSADVVQSSTTMPEDQKHSVLATRGLVKQYRRRAVVNRVDVQVEQGQIVGLLGPNGAGKTTTFLMMCGMVTPDKGDVFIDDRKITRLPMYKRARLGIGYLAQEASVFQHLTVEDNLRAVLEYQPISKTERNNRIEQLLEEFGIERIRKSKGYMLSGGERRRCEIARALATQPKFLLLDEPFAGVDPIAVEDIQRIVAHLKTKNIGIVISDHNVHETLAICDVTYILYKGELLRHGTAEELAADEAVRKSYLGENFSLERYRF